MLKPPPQHAHAGMSGGWQLAFCNGRYQRGGITRPHYLVCKNAAGFACTLLCQFLDFLAQRHAHAAENLAQGFEEGIAEGLNAEGVDAADALRLDQAALDAGNHGPDVAEGDAGKQEAPQERHRDAEDGRQDAVAPVFGHGEGGVAELPHPVQTVRPIRLRDDILKLHLRRHLRRRLISTDVLNQPPVTAALVLNVKFKVLKAFGAQFMHRTSLSHGVAFHAACSRIQKHHFPQIKVSLS